MMVLFQVAVTVVAVFFGNYALPKIQRYLYLKFGVFDGSKADRLVKISQMEKIDKMRKSRAFKLKMTEILELVKQDSAAGRKQVEIAFLTHCEFDQQIREELTERGFETRDKGNNMLQISWAWE